MLVATGETKLFRNIEGSDKMKNITLFNNKQDHENVLRELKRGVKKVTVVGANMDSLEFVSTLRREFPKVHISVVDENRESVVHQQYGKSVADSIVQ